MAIPAALVLAITLSIHGYFLLMILTIGYGSYRVYHDYVDEMYDNIFFDVVVAMLVMVFLIWLTTVFIRMDLTLRRIHEKLS